jgi:hypothetical protein
VTVVNPDDGSVDPNPSNNTAPIRVQITDGSAASGTG